MCQGGQVEEVVTQPYEGEGVPRLSHHAAALVADCLLLVGGWDGKAR